MTDLSTTPQTTDPSTGEPLVAHIVRKDQVTDAYVFGTPIEALCGYRWVPSRNPDRYPVCPACVEVADRVGAAGEN